MLKRLDAEALAEHIPHLRNAIMLNDQRWCWVGINKGDWSTSVFMLTLYWRNTVQGDYWWRKEYLRQVERENEQIA